MGLEPIAHPPGKDTLAIPYYASRGPSTKTPARIVLRIWLDAKVFNVF